MIKKLTLSAITALSLLSISAVAQGMGNGMMQQANMPQKQKMMKKKKNSPFLIKRGLPHMTKLLMMNWDDPKLALTPEQKEKLMVVRKETIGGVRQIKPEVNRLRKEIVQAIKSGAKADTLKEKVEKLASLEAEATMIHLRCIENTKAVLSQEQLAYLMQKQKQKRMNRTK